MSSYRQILYHIVFRTKSSKKTLTQEYVKELYAYILGTIKNKNGFLYRINGIEDHIHILCDLHPNIALAYFVRDIKTSSSIWLKQSGKFSNFEGWADGYAALTYAWKDKEMIVNYIINQKEHHKNESFEDELRRLLREHGVDVNESYFP
ncbi:MAG: IS200/IS605 family transposase [Bacteroidales bacterium]|nr:IS200/IS605 family transposase [Bacteroidales bacterium]